MVKMLIGLPGCGKSTYANKQSDFIVLSSDTIRKKEYGSEDVQRNPKYIFNKLYERFEILLSHGKNVILDATNIKKKDRRVAIQIAQKYNQPIEAVLFAVPLDICKERNAHRERTVKDSVYDRMLCQFDMPTKEEGFSAITIIND